MLRQSTARDYATRAYTIGVSGSQAGGRTLLVLAMCRLLRDNYSIVVVTGHIGHGQDGGREFLIRHKALASSRIVDGGRDPENVIESPMSEFRPELIFLDDAVGDRERIDALADFAIHVVDGSADRISSDDTVDVAGADLLVINKTHLGAPLDLQRNLAVRHCAQARGDGPTVFTQLRHGIGTFEIARHFLASWRRTSAPEVWAPVVDERVALTPA